LKNANDPRRINNLTNDVEDSENYTILLSKITPEYILFVIISSRDGLNEMDLLKRADLVLGNLEKFGCKRFFL
jgi:hypothetical protein